MSKLSGTQIERLVGVIEDLQQMKSEKNDLDVSIKEKTNTVKMVLREAGVDDKEIEVIGKFDVSLNTIQAETLVSNKDTNEMVRAKVAKAYHPILFRESTQERLTVKEHKTE